VIFIEGVKHILMHFISPDFMRKYDSPPYLVSWGFFPVSYFGKESELEDDERIIRSMIVCS